MFRIEKDGNVSYTHSRLKAMMATAAGASVTPAGREDPPDPARQIASSGPLRAMPDAVLDSAPLPEADVPQQQPEALAVQEREPAAPAVTYIGFAPRPAPSLPSAQPSAPIRTLTEHGAPPVTPVTDPLPTIRIGFGNTHDAPPAQVTAQPTPQAAVVQDDQDDLNTLPEDLARPGDEADEADYLGQHDPWDTDTPVAAPALPQPVIPASVAVAVPAQVIQAPVNQAPEVQTPALQTPALQAPRVPAPVAPARNSPPPGGRTDLPQHEEFAEALDLLRSSIRQAAESATP